MKIQILLIGPVVLLGSPAVGQVHMKSEEIVLGSGFKPITLKVPKDWKVTARKTGSIELKDSTGRICSILVLHRKVREDELAFRSVLETLADFQKRTPESVKQWKKGASNYATTLFTSKTGGKVTLMSTAIWNGDIALIANRSLSRVIDLQEAQDWELTARSVQLSSRR